MIPVGKISLIFLSFSTLFVIFTTYTGIRLVREEIDPVLGAFYTDEALWIGLFMSVVGALILISILLDLGIVLFRGSVGLSIKGDRLVQSPFWARPIALQDVVSVTEGQRIPILGKPNSIDIRLANGRMRKINTLPFRTPVAEMVAAIKAHAPRLAAAAADDGAPPPR